MARRQQAVLEISEIIPKFYGGYWSNLDDKGRACIPARIREILDLHEMKTLMLRGHELSGFPVIHAYPASYFRDKILPMVSQLDAESAIGIYQMNKMMSTCYQVRLDSQGRINIPSELVQAAQIEKEIKVVGLNDFFDMWHPNNYEQFQLAGDNKKFKE